MLLWWSFLQGSRPHFPVYHNNPGVCTSRPLSPTPRVSNTRVYGGAREFSFPTNSQELLLLLVQGPHTENPAPGCGWGGGGGGGYSPDEKSE